MPRHHRRQKRATVYPEALPDANVCMMAMLGIPRTMKESCFSDQQIDTLFELWKEFMLGKFQAGGGDQNARLDIEQLYSSATSTRRKYTALRLDQNTGSDRTPAMYAHESTWVMGDGDAPTPFIAFLRSKPRVMEDLRMSFKPNMTHGGRLEPTDFMALLLRYAYWLKDDKDRSVNILGVIDERATTGITTESLLGNLRQNYNAFRFHVALLNESNTWYAVLVDRVSKTFEFYDPLGRPLEIANPRTPVAERVASLYEAAMSLDSAITTQSMYTVNRPMRRHQPESGSECDVYVILYLQARIVHRKTFEAYADSDVRVTNCNEIKEQFFVFPGEKDKQKVLKNEDYKLRYGNWDVRLAALNLYRYQEQVIGVLTNQEEKQRIRQDQQALMALVRGPGSYVEIMVSGMRFQKNMMAALPVHFRDYAGANVFAAMIQEVHRDPLTEALRKVTSGESKRSKNTVRRTMAESIYRSIVGWSEQLGAPKDQVQIVQNAARKMLDDWYIPTLLFEADNKAKFSVGMDPKDFVRKCMTRVQTVSFGVHFMREMLTFIARDLQIKVATDLNTKYAVKSSVVQPISPANMEEIRAKITRCDALIQQAYALLQNTFTERMTMKKVTASQKGTIVSGQAPFPNAQVESQLVAQVVQLVRKDIEDRAFFANSTLNPWSFPLHVPTFITSTGMDLPDPFKVYSMNQADMVRLLQNETYMLCLAIEVMIITHHVSQGLLTNHQQTISIVAMSLIQLYSVAQPMTDVQQALCVMISRLHTALNASRYLGIDNIKHELARYNQVCTSTGLANRSDSPFFQKVHASYKAIYG